MEPRVNYALTGLFIVVLGAALLGVVLWLSKGEYRGDYERYYAYMRESVSGLSVNASLKYRGVVVGRVKEIVLNPDNPEEVRLAFDILRGTPVKEDTIAVLEVQGLTGLAFVDLSGGSRESPLLAAKNGEPYPVIKTGPSLLFRLDTAVSRLLADQTLTRLMTNVSGLAEDARTVVDEENRAVLKQILADLAAVTHALAARTDRVDRTMAGAAQAMDNLAKLTRTVNEELPPLLHRLNRVAVTLQGMTDEASRTSRAAGAVMNEAKPSLEQLHRQTLPETALLVGELRQLTATLQRVATQLEQEPNALFFGRHPAPPGPGE